MSDATRLALIAAGTLEDYQALVVQIARLRARLPWTDDDYNALLIACRARNALVSEALAKHRGAAA